MKQTAFITLLMFSCLALLGGCGGGGGSDPDAAKNTLHESQTCIGCHESSSWKTPGTGQNIVTDWTASTHNSTTNGASCQDCHGSGYMHPGSCNKCHSVGIVAVNPLVNPDSSNMCVNCHAKVNPRPGKFDGFNLLTYSSSIRRVNPAPTTAFTHFSTGKRANYVATNYIQNCRKCHNPHDTSSGKQQRQDWAQSGHGDTTTSARTQYDFKTMGSQLPDSVNYGSACVRCHTSTGPINYIESGFIDVKPLTVSAADKSRELTGCNVCHDNGSGYAYGYNVRSVGQITTFYNYSAGLTNAAKAAGAQSHVSVAKTFPDVSASNLCLLCHVGRESGESIKKAATQLVDFKGVTFISSHYLTAGASLFQISGYEYQGRDYTSQGTYPHLHRSIGLANNYGTGTSGPCVTCHLKPARHTFLPVSLADNAVLWQRQVTGIVSPECGKCHGNNPSVAPGLPALTVSGMNVSKSGFFAALEVLKTLLNSNGMYYGRGGIKTTAGLGTNVTNWEKFGVGSGPDTMGTAYNYVLLNTDYGAYAHNSIYAKRLLYDSIDYLSNNATPYSTCAHLASSNATAYEYICNSTTTGTSTERQ